jgi:hypothetical protein
LYASETWCLTKQEEGLLHVVESKVLRRIFGPVKDGEVWRIRYNRELYELLREPDIIVVMKIARLRWAGHVFRISDSEMSKRIMNYNPEGKRRTGRPKARWTDAVDNDMRRQV